MKRKALGRGLGALIPDVSRPGTELLSIDIDLIDPNPYQPRTASNRGDLDQLVRSIKDKGIVQPILVRRTGNRFQLIAGERRWLASQQAGLLKVPAVLREVSDDQLLEYALIENIQRQQLTAIEEANAYRKLTQDLGLTQDEVAAKVGKDRATIANTLRLLNLAPSVKEWLHEGKLAMGHARALLSLADAKQQLDLAREAIAKGMSVRGVETRVQLQRADASKAALKKRSADPNVSAAESRLRQTLGTKVEIKGQSRRGKIVIHYYSEEDLNRLYERLTGN